MSRPPSVTEKNDGQLALEDLVQRLPGVGSRRADALAALGIHTLRDLLFHFPRKYEDRTRVTPLADLQEDQVATIFAEVVKARNVRLRGRMSLATVELKDESGRANATFFGRGFLAKTVFQPGRKVFLTGLVSQYRGLALKNPDYEILEEGDEALSAHRIVPIYPLTEGLTQRLLRQWVEFALERLPPFEDTLPPALAARYGFPEVNGALRELHYPASMEAAERARERFVYEELLRLQQRLLEQRRRRIEDGGGIAHSIDGPALEQLRKELPFTLTRGQAETLQQILADMAAPAPMARLLQGDVGSGKTIVAMHAIAAAADGGWQTAVMAPTEILVEQHARRLRPLLDTLRIPFIVLTGSSVAAKSIRNGIETGYFRVVFGTHALFQERTRFSKLGLVIIDEQHRFGVLERQRLVKKGEKPDILHMTATPIPRSLALTLYGAMDLSIIIDLPPGRLPVKTRRITPAKISGLYDYVHEQAAKGFQTYIVCPLVEQSETRALTNVMEHIEALREGPLQGLRVGMLHGRLDAKEKDAVMSAFAAGEIDVLCCTTVIEVGVDVANATTMIIEDAANFGLTQLHQLRGRVGRGPEQSYCFLLGKPATKEGLERLEILCAYTSGFDIAEEDLKMRGPGELFGQRQAGESDLKIADLVKDARLLDRARTDAEELESA